MELNDQLEKRGKRARIKTPKRFTCPQCGERCTTLIKDRDLGLESRAICEDCYEKQNN